VSIESKFLGGEFQRLCGTGEHWLQVANVGVLLDAGLWSVCHHDTGSGKVLKFDFFGCEKENQECWKVSAKNDGRSNVSDIVLSEMVGQVRDVVENVSESGWDGVSSDGNRSFGVVSKKKRVQCLPMVGERDDLILDFSTGQ